jgi:hypothetical protein
MAVLRRAIAATFIVGAGLMTAGSAGAVPAAPAHFSGVSPEFECSAPNSDGTYTAFFSYTSTSKNPVEVPEGIRNFVFGTASATSQPTTFTSGRHVAVFGVRFDKRVPPSWVLDFEVATANTRDLCSAPAELSENASWMALPGASLGAIGLWALINRRRRAGDAPEDSSSGLAAA